MAGENEMRIIFGADTTPLRTEVTKATSTVDKFADSVEQAAGDATKGFEQLQKSVKGIPQAFDKVAGGSVVLTRIAGNLDAAGKAAIDSTKSFKVLEGAPLQTLDKLDAAIAQIRLSLANGFKANLDTSGLSPQVFAQVGREAKQVKDAILSLALSLNQAIVESKAFGSTLEKQFHLGISEELQRAGVSVAAFKDALASLTGTGGANLTPLLQALDSIQAESSGTTTAIKSIGSALQGVSVLAKAPINDLVALDQELKVIKATLASGFQPSIEKINLQPGDFQGIQNDINQANNAVENFGQTVNKTMADSVAKVEQLKDSAGSINGSFNGANTAAKEVDNLGKSLNAFGAEGEKWLNPFKDAPKVLRTQQIELKILDDELRKVRATLNSGFKPALDGIKLTSSGFDSLGKSARKVAPASKAAESALTDLGRVAQDLPFGLMGIANNITPLFESLRRLGSESKGAGGFFKNLGASLIGGGGLVFAFSAATAAIQIAQYGIQSFGRKTKEADDKFKDFLASLKNSKTITQEATGSVEDEIAKVQTLTSVIKDVNASTNDRKRALQELKQVNKSYFGDLTLESAALGTLTAATDEYTKALVNQAIAKGFADELAKISVELRKQEGILTKLEGKHKSLGAVTKEEQLAASKFGAAYQDVQKIVNKGDAEDAFIKQRNVVEDLRGEMVALKSDYQDALKEGLKFKDLQKDPVKGHKEDAQLKSLKIQLGDLKDELETINKLREAGILPKFREDDAEQLSKKILDVLQKIDKREVEIKLKPKLSIDPQLNEFELDKVEQEANKRLAFTKMQAPLSLVIDKKLVISQIQGISNETLKKTGIKSRLDPIIAVPFGKTNELLKKAGLDQIEVPINTIKLPADGIKISGGVSKIVKAAQEKLQANLDAQKERLTVNITAESLSIGDDQFVALVKEFTNLGLSAADAFNKAISVVLGQGITKTLRQGLDAAFVNIGDSIATAFNGGGIAAAAESFLAIIGGVLQEVGKQIIVASALVKALKESLTTLFAAPEAVLGVGIALVALGGILKNIKLDKPQKFAEGGIVRGPTMGLLGEAGPEMVIPLNRANQFIENAGGNGFVAETALRGRDIVLMIRRELANQSKTGGLNFG